MLWARTKRINSFKTPTHAKVSPRTSQETATHSNPLLWLSGYLIQSRYLVWITSGLWSGCTVKHRSPYISEHNICDFFKSKKYIGLEN
jgi:hypothetical protein